MGRQTRRWHTDAEDVGSSQTNACFGIGAAKLRARRLSNFEREYVGGGISAPPI